MNTAAGSVMTQRAVASNKIFNRVRQNWMRGFVNELNGRETERWLRVPGDFCRAVSRGPPSTHRRDHSTAQIAPLLHTNPPTVPACWRDLPHGHDALRGAIARRRSRDRCL